MGFQRILSEYSEKKFRNEKFAKKPKSLYLKGMETKSWPFQPYYIFAFC